VDAGIKRMICAVKCKKDHKKHGEKSQNNSQHVISLSMLWIMAALYAGSLTGAISFIIEK